MKLYDLLWKRDEDSQGKARWEKIGVLIEKEGKKQIKIDVLPVGNWDGWLVVSERRDRDTTREPF